MESGLNILRDRGEGRRSEKRNTNSKTTHFRYNVAVSSGNIYIGFRTDRTLLLEQSIMSIVNQSNDQESNAKGIQVGCLQSFCAFVFEVLKL